MKQVRDFPEKSGAEPHQELGMAALLATVAPLAVAEAAAVETLASRS